MHVTYRSANEFQMHAQCKAWISEQEEYAWMSCMYSLPLDETTTDWLDEHTQVVQLGGAHFARGAN